MIVNHRITRRAGRRTGLGANVRTGLGTVLCVVLCTVTGSASAHGPQQHTGSGHSTRISTVAPPAGVHSLEYHRSTAIDARAELREIRAASRDARRARTAAPAGAGGPGGLVESAGVQALANVPATTAGAAAAHSTRTKARHPAANSPGTRAGSGTGSRKRARPAQQSGTANRTGPGRQRTPVPRAAAPRTTVPRAPLANTPVGAGSGVVGFALAQVGKGYGFGSVGPDRFDCSGLVAAAFRRAGISLPHQTGALARVGRPVGRGELLPGDLVFPSAGHVGIYVGGGRIVHASTERGGVKNSPIYSFRFARRIG
jgi:cell wall-associated NlpC family hydrolase